MYCPLYNVVRQWPLNEQTLDKSTKRPRLSLRVQKMLAFKISVKIVSPFTCYKVDSFSLWSFRGRSRTIHSFINWTVSFSEDLRPFKKNSQFRIKSAYIVVSISEITSLYLASVAAQAGLCLIWSQTPKTGFLVTRLISVKVKSQGHPQAKHVSPNGIRTRGAAVTRDQKSRLVTKPTKWHVRPAKTQISLRSSAQSDQSICCPREESSGP